MFKEIAKDANTSWDDIARCIYGTTERAGDIEKLNNNIVSGNILVPNEDDTIESNVVGICLEKGDKIYKGFSEHLLIDKLGAIKGAVMIFVETDENYDFNFYEAVKIYDESGLFLKGRIANIFPNANNQAKWTQVEVKSSAGILLESDLPYPLEYMNLSIRTILTNIAGYYGLSIEFSDAPELDEIITNEIGTAFTAGINEKAFNFMSRLCLSRGLLLDDKGNGLFVGRFNPNTAEKINFIEGDCIGVKSIRAEFKTDGLARYYEVNSQYPKTESVTVQIPFPIPIIKRFNSNDYNSEDLQSIATKIACKAIGDAFKLRIVLNEYLAVKKGDFVIVKYPSAKIYKETDFVIEDIIPKAPDETYLILTLPCAYTGIIPEELPLCS